MSKKVLITGANKGIGFETARQLGEQDWYILLGARNEQRGMEAVNTLQREGINVKWVRIDLNHDETIDSAAQYIRAHHSDIN
ncbi:SDR family NAD(P)-dependent oxidoreductase, partial [Staphylococcus aureus]|nr:SDR family NAD(P)-dependent oxidoreductase [Staphylococcus aureus]